MRRRCGGGAGWLRLCCVSCSSSTWWSMSLLCRSSMWVSSFCPKVALPVAVQDWVLVQTVQSVVSPQLQFSDKVETCPLLRRQVHLVSSCRKLWRYRSCSVCRCLLAQFIADCGRPCDHAETFLVQFLDKSSSCPLRADSWGPDVQKTVLFHSCSSRQAVDVPVIKQRRLRSGSATD